MKMAKYVLLTAIAVMPEIWVAAENCTLPDGRVLENPYVVGRRPNGVEVAHKTGVMFIKFKDMPPAISKELNYDPEEAQKYEETQCRLKIQRARQAANEQNRQAVIDKAYRARIEQMELTQLERDVTKTEIRIERLKLEIPKLETQCDSLLDKTANTSQSDSGGTFAWRGGIIHRGQSSNRNSHLRSRVVAGLAEEYSSAKFRLRSYKDELERKEGEIIEMKQRLEELKNAKGGQKSGNFIQRVFNF